MGLTWLGSALPIGRSVLSGYQGCGREGNFQQIYAAAESTTELEALSKVSTLLAKGMTQVEPPTV